MKIVQTVPPSKTKEKKYMFICKTCQKEENGFNYGKTKFIADYPNDFFEGYRTPNKYCECPICGNLYSKSIVARLRYLWYKIINQQLKNNK